MDIDLGQLKDLMRTLSQFDLSELEIEKNGERIKLTRHVSGGVAQVHGGAPPLAAVVPAAPPSPSLKPAVSEDDAHVHYITSPFVGTYYECPSPNSPAFVHIGSEIKPGDTLCIVEAMKLMNEIEADVAGTILEIYPVSGKPVEYGERLFKVKKKA